MGADGRDLEHHPTEFFVARLTKRNEATYAGDYDKIDLWVFNGEAPRSMAALGTPDASTAPPVSDWYALGANSLPEWPMPRCYRLRSVA